MVKFKLIEIVYQNDANFGVRRDTYINNGATTHNYGGSRYLLARDGVTGMYESHILVEVKLPEEKDIDGFDQLEEAYLEIYEGVGTVGGTRTVGITSIDEAWTEGTGGDAGAVGEASWNDAQPGIPWANPGAIASVTGTIEPGAQIYTVHLIGINTWHRLPITPFVKMGETKTIVLMITASGTSSQIAAYSIEDATASTRIRLVLKYRDYATEAFTNKDSVLSIEPNPNNPEQPLLKWGGVKDTDFVNFKLYRDTVPITTIAGLSGDGVLLATITSPEAQEYVDKTVPTDGTEDGTTFYYMVIAEDGNSTGDDATRSANVSFTKPGVATVTVSPSGASNVGATKTLTVTSGNDIKRLYADWKDGSKTWYTYEIVGTTQTAAHVYSSKFTSTTLSVRVEDELGFWSSETDTSTSISIADTTPKAVLVARPTEVVVGETVHMNASLSHPMASNEIITDYKYTYGAITTAWVIDPFFSYKTVTEGAAVAHKVRVKTQGGLEADSDVTYIAIVSDEAELLTFSRDTVITTRGEKRSTLYSTSSIQGGDAEVDVRSGLSNVSITLNGLSSKNNLNADLTLLKEAVEDYAFVKILVTDEICGTNVYYEGRIVNYSLTKTSKRVASWTAEMRVVKRDDGT